MQKNPIGWVELPAEDLDRAEAFYKEYFGFDLERQEEKGGFTMSFFPMEMEGYGSAVALMKGESYIPSHEGPVLYFTAPGGTVEAGLAKAKQQSVPILLDKKSIGEHGFIAFIQDSEGNRIAIHSMEG